MAGIAAPNFRTFELSTAAVAGRNAEYPGSPFNDVNGDGNYNTYLGCNRAGSCAPGIGIVTGEVHVLAGTPNLANARPAAWTQLDQSGAARIPQNSGHIGHVNAAVPADDPNNFTPAVNPVTIANHEAQDFNNTANLVVTDTAAANGAVMHVPSGTVNRTGAAVAIGDLVWGDVPVA